MTKRTASRSLDSNDEENDDGRLNTRRRGRRIVRMRLDSPCPDEQPAGCTESSPNSNDTNTDTNAAFPEANDLSPDTNAASDTNAGSPDETQTNDNPRPVSEEQDHESEEIKKKRSQSTKRRVAIRQTLHQKTLQALDASTPHLSYYKLSTPMLESGVDKFSQVVHQLSSLQITNDKNKLELIKAEQDLESQKQKVLQMALDYVGEIKALQASNPELLLHIPVPPSEFNKETARQFGNDITHRRTILPQKKSVVPHSTDVQKHRYQDTRYYGDSRFRDVDSRWTRDPYPTDDNDESDRRTPARPLPFEVERYQSDFARNRRIPDDASRDPYPADDNDESDRRSPPRPLPFEAERYHSDFARHQRIPMGRIPRPDERYWRPEGGTSVGAVDGPSASRDRRIPTGRIPTPEDRYRRAENSISSGAIDGPSATRDHSILGERHTSWEEVHSDQRIPHHPGSSNFQPHDYTYGIRM